MVMMPTHGEMVLCQLQLGLRQLDSRQLGSQQVELQQLDLVQRESTWPLALPMLPYILRKDFEGLVY